MRPRIVREGELAEKAAAMPVPSDVKLKDPKQFKLIGKRVARKDNRAKTNGSAQFTIDVKLPGTLTAVVAHPPLFGAKVQSFDAAKAKSIRGVVNVVQIPTGVAVLATDFWLAKRGRDALSVQWDESGAGKLDSPLKKGDWLVRPSKVVQPDPMLVCGPPCGKRHLDE
jgi:isoquinoline 1-oxidoreductase beta subunit